MSAEGAKLAQAINRVRECAEIEAAKIEDGQRLIVNTMFILQAAAFALAQACGVSDMSELEESTKATWDAVAKARKGDMSKGGDA